MTRPAADGAFEKVLEAMRTGTIRFSESKRLGLDFLEPQELFDALPEPTKSRIDLDDFKAVCQTIFAMFVIVRQRELAEEVTRHVLAIDEVVKR